jgi:glycosyltransferase involved in cell wall biosynthesis
VNNPRVSVIMPVYNVEAYVADAVESVLAQTFTDFELIIVDDGGADRSINICRGFRDQRIRILPQANRGLAGARNTGILHSCGEYIALLDSDDRWLPDKLLLHVIHLDADPSVSVSFSGSRFIDACGSPLRQAQRPKLSGVVAGDILCRNPVGNGSAAVIRRTALDAVAFPHAQEAGRLCYFDESFRQSEDIELWVRLALNNFKFDGISGLLTEYRILNGGLSANVARQYESWERMLAKARSANPAFVAQYEARARAYQLRYLARRCVQMGDGSFAAALLRDAFRASVRPLFEEPLKTAITCGATIVARLVSPARLAALGKRWTGAEVLA